MKPYNNHIEKQLTRRQILKLGGTLLGLGATSAFLPRNLLQPSRVVEASNLAQTSPPDLHFAASDGWIYLPEPAVSPYHPDNMAPDLLTTYIFGFRDVTGIVAHSGICSEEQSAVGCAYMVDKPGRRFYTTDY